MSESFKELVLNKIKIGMAHQISHTALESLEVQEIEDILQQKVTYVFSMWLLGNTVHTKQYEDEDRFNTVPLTWWDMFIETYHKYIPKWYFHRYPIRYKIIPIHVTVKQEYTKVCPHIDTDPIGAHAEFLDSKFELVKK